MRHLEFEKPDLAQKYKVQERKSQKERHRERERGRQTKRQRKRERGQRIILAPAQYLLEGGAYLDRRRLRGG